MLKSPMGPGQSLFDKVKCQVGLVFLTITGQPTTLIRSYHRHPGEGQVYTQQGLAAPHWLAARM